MQQAELFKLKLEDGDDIVVIPHHSNRGKNSLSVNRSMENIGENSTSSEDDRSNDALKVNSSLAGNDDKKPKLTRPPSAFCLFFRDYEKALKVSQPSINMAQLQQMAMQYWEAMDSTAKQRYIDENTRLKQEYDKTMAALAARPGIQGRTCRRLGCSKSAVENKAWDRDFCSAYCVVAFCRNVFSSWVEENKKRPRP